MRIKTIEERNGMTFLCSGRKYFLKYPAEIWKAYPQRPVLIDNLSHLLTINTPLIAGKKEVIYNTSEPF
ncbi:hypothetical protein JXA85_07100, partial [Candidatus Woesearchaeota archaeon]|nr:hypothetical protein [Candidatus Woesearchaeota archaeon]